MASDATNLTFFQQLFSIKILTKLSYWVYIFLDHFSNFTQMPKKPFLLRSVQVPYQICKKNRTIKNLPGRFSTKQ